MKSWDAALIKIFTVMQGVHFCEKKRAYVGSRRGGVGGGSLVTLLPSSGASKNTVTNKYFKPRGA